jgi:hypothetical protein
MSSKHYPEEFKIAAVKQVTLDLTGGCNTLEPS